MRIVVTGAKGFIGSILAKRAMEIGHDVLALDDCSRGLNAIGEPHMLIHPRGKLLFVKHDCQGGLLEAVASGGHCYGDQPVDAVVHLAAGTGSLDRPIGELRALNVEMTKRVYEDARALGAKVFVFPTTSLGIIDSLKDSPYVLSKEEAFEWVKTQSDPRPLPLRFFNVIGAYKGFSEFRKKEVHIIPKIVESYLTGSPFVINGDDYKETVDGTPSRTFIHVLDIVKNILFRAQHVVQSGMPWGEPAFDGAYWIGARHTVTVRQVLDVFEQFVGPVHSKVGPRRQFDCGEVLCKWLESAQAEACAGGLAPAWVGIRDEAFALIQRARDDAEYNACR